MFASREVRGWKALVPFQWHRDGRELPRPFSLSAPPATVRRLFILVLVASWLQGDSHSARHRIFITGRRKAPTIYIRTLRLGSKASSEAPKWTPPYQPEPTSHGPELTPWLPLTRQEAGRVRGFPTS